MMKRNVIALVGCVTLIAAPIWAAARSGDGSGQASATAAAVKMPKQPKELLMLASQVNGLGATDMKPWHLKAAYEVYDADGNPKYQGTFEEWWAAPDKYKASFSDPGFHQVEYVDDKKVMISGDISRPLIEDLIDLELKYPLPPAMVLRNAQDFAETVKIGKAKLDCISRFSDYGPKIYQDGPGKFSYYATDAQGGITPSPLEYVLPTVDNRVCIQEDAPILRAVVSEGSLLITFNQVISVDGHYAAKEFWVKNGDLPLLHVVLEELDGRKDIDDSVFEAPPTATAAKLIRVSFAEPGAHHPPHAGKAEVHGSVIIEGTITKAGKLRGLHFVSGLAALRPGAMDDAKEVHLHPVTIKKQPVEGMIDLYLLYPKQS